MFIVALFLAACAGLLYCAGAWMRWRLVHRQGEHQKAGWMWPVWLGLSMHSVALTLALIDGQHFGFLFAVLGSWATVASLFFIAHYFALPSRGLLVLPLGAAVIVLAMFGFADHLRTSGYQPAYESGEIEGQAGLLLHMHVIGIAVSFAALLLSSACSTVYLLAKHKLKKSVMIALRLPKLPDLEIISERSFVISAALLLGGSVLGGVLVYTDETPRLSPTAITGIVVLVMMCSLVVMRGRRHLSGRAMSIGILMCLVLMMLAAGMAIAGGTHAS